MAEEKNQQRAPKLITDQLMIACCNLRAPANQSVAKFLKKLTHLNLNDRKLDSMEGLSVCKSLKNLYLYNNNIPSIVDISGLRNLTHLYLENNRICTIENLPVEALQKLYLNENSIEVVSGVEGCEALSELHIANQRLPIGQPLNFPVSTLDALAPTLLVLNIAGNNLSDVSFVLNLPGLRKLNLAKNAVASMESALSLTQLEYLTDLDLRHNPVARVPKYMENLVANSGQYLAVLDGKEVVENHREMLRNLVRFKSGGMKRQQQMYDESGYGDEFGVSGGGYDMGGTGGMGGGNENWGAAENGAIDFDPSSGEFR